MAKKEGFVTEEDNYAAVVLDTNLTPDLIEEGFVRELISKIQTMRKESGFEVTDHIRAYMADEDGQPAKILEANAGEIGREVLADSVEVGQEALEAARQKASQPGVNPVFVKEWNINGENVTLGVTKA